MSSAWWPHLRAVLILVHLVAVTALALPAPGGGMDRRTWREPTVQAEFAAWRARLLAFGVVVEPKAFEDALWAGSVALMDARSKVLAPFQPYYDLTGTHQSWRMFVAPHLHPARLHIDVRRGGEWSPVFIERDDTAVWKRSVLDNDRLRSFIFRLSWPNYRSSYRAFVTWVGDRAAEDFPDADAVRVRFATARTLTPQEVLRGVEPKVQFTQVQEVDLTKLRAEQTP